MKKPRLFICTDNSRSALDGYGLDARAPEPLRGERVLMAPFSGEENSGRPGSASAPLAARRAAFYPASALALAISISAVCLPVFAASHVLPM